MKFLDYWIKNKEKREERISKFTKKGTIQHYSSLPLVNIFIEKAEYNLKACFDNINLGYFDWAINASYYAIYMASQALLLKKGYKSKSHKATILLLIDIYLNKGMTKEEIELISRAEPKIRTEDVSYFVYSKNIRENATYNPLSKYNKKQAEESLNKSRDFVNLAKRLIEQT